MSERPLRLAVAGVGQVGTSVTRIAAERGARIVGAFTRPGPKVGCELGEQSGLGRDLGVFISDDLGAVLAATQPDIVVVGISNHLDTLMPIYETALAAGVNVICAGGETAYAWPSSPRAAERLDSLARANGVTITGGGNQDFLIIRSGVHLAGVCHRITSITHRRVVDADQHGAAQARQLHIDEDPVGAGGSEQDADGGRLGVYGTFAHQIVADLGFSVARVHRTLAPVTYDADVDCRALDCVVAAGRTVGSEEVWSLETDVGIEVRIEAQFRLLRESERESIEWLIEGDPPVQMSIDPPSSHLTTATQLVNRLPDVVEAPSGYVTLDQLPPLRYHRSLVTQ
jgi:4-hydroxy-tetrahydrodipicolinate reductase